MVKCSVLVHSYTGFRPRLRLLLAHQSVSLPILTFAMIA